MSRTGRMNCWWERKCLAPMLVMQLIGCNGKLKATNIFLSWLLLCGNIRLTFSILELHSCSVKKRQDTFRLLGRCTPPSSGVVEWHWRKVKSPLLLTCTFPLHPLKCTTNSEATHSPSQKMCHLILPLQEKPSSKLKKSSNCSHTKKCQDRKLMLTFFLHAVYKLH